MDFTMYRNIGSRFCEMTRLYHFTSIEAAYSIIESSLLRFSKSDRLNDMIESNKIVYERIFSDRYLERKNYLLDFEKELQKYQQISFSQDREYDGQYFLGFDLHTMWGLYANKGYGICLVFDKSKLDLFSNDYAGNVVYDNFIPQHFVCHNKSRAGIKSEVWRRRDEIFFYKRKEWAYEQEYRVIRRVTSNTESEYLDVSKALAFVIVCKDSTLCRFGSMFDSPLYEKLNSLKKNIPILTYEYGLDGYTLFQNIMDPIWAEHVGFF